MKAAARDSPQIAYGAAIVRSVNYRAGQGRDLGGNLTDATTELAGTYSAADHVELRAGAAIVGLDFSISENSRVANFQESFRSIVRDRAKMWIAIVFAIARSFVSSRGRARRRCFPFLFVVTQCSPSPLLGYPPDLMSFPLLSFQREQGRRPPRAR